MATKLSNAQKTAIYQQLSDAGHGAAANQLFGKPKGKRGKQAKKPSRPLSKMEWEMVFILGFAVIIFFVGLHFFHH